MKPIMEIVSGKFKVLIFAVDLCRWPTQQQCPKYYRVDLGVLCEIESDLSSG